MLQTTLYKWTNNAAAGTNYQRIPKRTAADGKFLQTFASPQCRIIKISFTCPPKSWRGGLKKKEDNVLPYHSF
jgi:hypothetical protein